MVPWGTPLKTRSTVLHLLDGSERRLKLALRVVVAFGASRAHVASVESQSTAASGLTRLLRPKTAACAAAYTHDFHHFWQSAGHPGLLALAALLARQK